MRAVILHGSSDTYGASRVLIDEVSCLKSIGFQIVVILPSEGPLVNILREAGHTVEVDHTLTVVRKADKRSPFRRVSLPEVLRPDDLVVLWTLALARYIPTLMRRRVAFYVSVHELLPGLIGKLYARWFLARGDFNVTCASKACQRWLETCGVRTERLTVTYPVFETQGALGPWVKGRKTIAVFARVNGNKGHLEVAQAFRQLFPSPGEWRLLLYGSPFPGQERHLSDLIQAIDGRPDISYEGEVRSFASVSEKIGVVACFPNRPETFGLVPIEAWQYAVPAIGYADGGASEVLTLVGGLGVSRHEADGTSTLTETLATFIQDPSVIGQRPPEQDVLSHLGRDARVSSLREVVRSTLERAR